MKKIKTFIGMALVLAILILGVGYAAISNINLNITGTANVNANADFKVEFDKNHQIAIEGGTTEANAAYTDTLSATMTVSLDSATKTQSATYKIDNKSSELSATLNKYVTVTTQLYADEACTTTLTEKVAKDTSAYLKVTATLVNNPAQNVTDKEFTVTVTATPADAN